MIDFTGIAKEILAPILTAVLAGLGVVFQDWRTRRTKIGRRKLALEDARAQVAFTGEWWQAHKALETSPEALRDAAVQATYWLGRASTVMNRTDLAIPAAQPLTLRRILLLDPLDSTAAKVFRVGYLACAGVMVQALGASLTQRLIREDHRPERVYRLKQGVQWEELPPLRHARAAGAATVVKDKIVVVGGRDTRQLVPVTEVFDGSAWRDARAIPVPGDHLAAVSTESSVYAVGGRNLSADKNTAALQRYDVDTDRWTALGDMPTPRGGFGAALLKGSIIAVGGEAPTTAYDTAESYDIASGTWSVLPPAPEPRHGLAVATVGDRLFAAGGAATAGHTGSSATTVAFQPVAASATPGAPATPPAMTSAGADTSTASTSTTQATIYDCPAPAPPIPRACLTHAAVSSGGLTIAYTTNFTPSAVQDASHYHLHLFTANTKDGKSTDPSDSIMQGSTGPREGNWFILYANGVSRIDADTARGGRKAPLDLERFSLLCVRVATGLHELARGPSGGFDTGNCVPILR